MAAENNVLRVTFVGDTGLDLVRSYKYVDPTASASAVQTFIAAILANIPALAPAGERPQSAKSAEFVVTTVTNVPVS